MVNEYDGHAMCRDTEETVKVICEEDFQEIGVQKLRTVGSSKQIKVREPIKSIKCQEKDEEENNNKILSTTKQKITMSHNKILDLQKRLNFMKIFQIINKVIFYY